MKTREKKAKVKRLVNEMLKQSYNEMKKKVDKVITSGAVDIDSWNPEDKPMILPKCIATAILKDESTQYEAKGTSYEKQVKKEVKNIRYFL